jgi:hypothetical protein
MRKSLATTICAALICAGCSVDKGIDTTNPLEPENTNSNTSYEIVYEGETTKIDCNGDGITDLEIYGDSLTNESAVVKVTYYPK